MKSDPFSSFIDTAPAWAITNGSFICYTSVRKSRSEAWWAIQTVSGHPRRVLQKQGFKAEKILLVREEKKT